MTETEIEEYKITVDISNRSIRTFLTIIIFTFALIGSWQLFILKHYAIGVSHYVLILYMMRFNFYFLTVNYITKPETDPDYIKEANLNAEKLTKIISTSMIYCVLLFSIVLIYTYDMKWFFSIPIGVGVGIVYPNMLFWIVLQIITKTK